MIGIYKITCKANNKKYIGKATDLELRKQQHFSKLRIGNHPNMKLQDDFNKYGIDNFVFEILEECPEDKLDHLEDYYMLSNHSINHGYNQKRGDIFSLSDDDFNDDDYVGNEERYVFDKYMEEGYKPIVLQSLLYELNDLMGTDLKTRELLKRIYDNDKTKLFILKQGFKDDELEEISFDVAIELYDKYFLYILNPILPKEYIEYYNKKFKYLYNIILEIIDKHLGITCNEVSCKIEDTINKYENFQNIFILSDNYSEGFFYKVYFSPDGLNYDYYDFVKRVADINEMPNEYAKNFLKSLIDLGYTTVKKHLTMTYKDVTGLDLKEKIKLY